MSAGYKGSGHTIVDTRAYDQGHLSAEVAAVIPGLAAAARAAANARHRATTGQDHVTTTFCPLCGGNKTREALRCRACMNRALSKGGKAAIARGSWATGFTAGSTATARELMRASGTGAGSEHSNPTTGHRARGDGTSRKPEWTRHVLVNGKWEQVPE